MVHNLGGMSMSDSCLMAALWRSRRCQQGALGLGPTGSFCIRIRRIRRMESAQEGADGYRGGDEK
jgi:hypothetical protein